MPRPKTSPTQAKLKRQQRIQRYRTNPAVQERIKIQRKSYRQKKKEQARLQQHPDPLTKLTHIIAEEQTRHDYHYDDDDDDDDDNDDDDDDAFNRCDFGNDGFKNDDWRDDGFNDDDMEGMIIMIIMTDICRLFECQSRRTS
jgi:hypothetical protein